MVSNKYIGFLGHWLAILTTSLLIACTSDTNQSATPAKPAVKRTAKKAPAFADEGDLQIYTESDSILLDIEIADSDVEREKGMMYRTSMKSDRGMLFVFDRERPQSFWMKNTYIPLDLIFINQALNIVQISPNNIPATETQIVCKQPAKYVLEVNGGFAEAYNLRAGHKISWSRH